MYTIDCKTSEADYIEFNKFHMLNSNMGKTLLFVFRAIPPVLYFFIVLNQILKLKPPEVVIAVIIVNLFLVIMLLVFSKKILMLIAVLSVKLTSKDGKLPYFDHSTLLFEDVWITDSSEKRILKIKYSEIVKVCKTKTALYIYFSSTEAFLIQLGTMSEEYTAGLLDYINSRLTPSQKK